MSTPDRVPGGTPPTPRHDHVPADASDRSAGDRPVGRHPLRRETDGWLERWLATVADLARLHGSHPMLDAVIDEQVGRQVRIGDHWLTDFTSSAYLGLDLDPDVRIAVSGYLEAWGSHPGRPRMLGSPAPYERLETELALLVGAEDALLFPGITLTHLSVVPLLAGAGAVFLDARAHKALSDGAMIARSHGATLMRFRHGDLDHLEGLLRSTPARPRLILTPGVDPTTGNAADTRGLARLARESDALLYLDDAHGFGVLGERGSDELCEWGKRGNGVVRHQGEGYENLIVVAGSSHAYPSMPAFLALPSDLKAFMKVAAPPYACSEPPSVAAIAASLAGLEANERRGDLARYEAFRKTRRVLERIHRLALFTPNGSGLPIVGVLLGDRRDIDPAGRYLFDRGIHATIALPPLVPKDEVGFRFHITAAHRDDEIDRLCDALTELDERFVLGHRTEGDRAAHR